MKSIEKIAYQSKKSFFYEYLALKFQAEILGGRSLHSKLTISIAIGFLPNIFWFFI